MIQSKAVFVFEYVHRKTDESASWGVVEAWTGQTYRSHCLTSWSSIWQHTDLCLMRWMNLMEHYRAGYAPHSPFKSANTHLCFYIALFLRLLLTSRKAIGWGPSCRSTREYIYTLVWTMRHLKRELPPLTGISKATHLNLVDLLIIKSLEFYEISFSFFHSNPKRECLL